jgi:hypothetical protein
MESFYPLDRESLRHHLTAQQLKRWWVAEFAGIHKTTLRRWISGDIRRVREDRLARVAGILGLAPQALIDAGAGGAQRER